jgi:hypothetical protein
MPAVPGLASLLPGESPTIVKRSPIAQKYQTWACRPATWTPSSTATLERLLGL